MKIFWCVICLLWAGAASAERAYNFTYKFNGSARGTILLIIPYRVFYESSASVNFIAREAGGGAREFYFNGIAATGYMMRTSGFSGRTLVILAADYDFEKSIPFGLAKLADFGNISPYYAGYIKRKKNFQFQIFSRHPESIRFKRSPDGVVSTFPLDFEVRFRYHPEKLNIDFNIYRIMMEMLKIYNHPFTGKTNISSLKANPRQRWRSSPLDFTRIMNNVGPLAARIVKKLRPFKQEYPFRLRYRVTALDNRFLEIRGDARPRVPIWGNFNLQEFSRRVRLRLKDDALIEDSILIKVLNPRGGNLTIRAALNLIR